MTKTSRRATSLLACALWLAAAPAGAGGPLQPPDGVGNPSGGDYTGYSPRFLVPGILDSATQETRVTCFNASAAPATVVYQAYLTGGDASRPPVGDDQDLIAPTETAVVSNLTGTAPSIGIGRILVSDARTPVLCEARVIDSASGDTIAVLSLVPIGRAPRIRIR